VIFHKNYEMIGYNYVTDGLKAQKHLAQGIALGAGGRVCSPCKGKSSNMS
jgi:hypothetical protein